MVHDPPVRRVLLDAACTVPLSPDRDVAAVEDAAPRPAVRGERDHAPVPGDVVVAVGRARPEGSVRFAVQEAAARGVGVHLVHVVRMWAVDGVPTAELWRDAAAEGRLLLDGAVGVARAGGGPHLRVTHHLVEQGSLVRDLVHDLVDDLVDESAHASVLVVQHRHLGPVLRRVTRSVTSALASRTDVPVVAVPAAWSSSPGRAGCVVVGLQDEDDAASVLPLALEEATGRALPLRVLHAGSLGPTDRTRLLARVEEVHRRYPAVTLQHGVKDEDPVGLLLGTMSSAEVVVIGRRRGALPWHSHLGPVARGVLEGATCPVVLVPAAGPR